MIALLLLALALASDAFAVALVRGVSGERRVARALETGLAFGLAQGLMPLAGWTAGTLVLSELAAIDHWIVFALLAFLGWRMVQAGLAEQAAAAAGAPAGALSGAAAGARAIAGQRLSLLAAALATSIDAAAAGLTLETFGFPLVLACATIGLVTMVLCAPAYWLAARIGPRLGSRAMVAGGVVLMALGAAVVIDHSALV